MRRLVRHLAVEEILMLCETLLLQSDSAFVLVPAELYLLDVTAVGEGIDFVQLHLDRAGVGGFAISIEEHIAQRQEKGYICYGQQRPR